MQRRRSPLLLISLVVALFIVLVVVSAKMPAPPPDPHEVATGTVDQDQPKPSESPEEMMRRVKGAEKTGKAPAPPAKATQMPVKQSPPPDRYEEGSGNWWTNSTSPKAPGK